ncbi:hypothetical protein MLD38_020988 [Melastoma candidum]|uniref:Uncharacterized protein n=1 Tax=Melastoma candidum TaxID=119954 RepID=A0ACB9QHL6_9MYRT|nr:hypothetical protein MLD38_020988 [Melastoma candidum]
METPSFLLAFSSQPYLVASVFFTVLGLVSLFLFVVSASSSKSRPSVSDDCCSDDTAGSCSDPSPSHSSMAIGGTVAAATVERNAGASMMEQLVPEITTHALSYLDYTSLCRLSMTNSLMRKAANDDNAWKVLYHKDFTLEQGSVTPVNGWKAYYAATRAVVNVNSEFFDIIKERSLQAMSRLWFNADYVKCFHASGEFFSGYNAVIQSWQLAFNWDQGVDFLVRDVRVRVMTDMAWVTMKTFVGNMDAGPFNVTNIFEFHNGRWYMVHHHNSVMFIDGEMGQQNLHG